MILINCKTGTLVKQQRIRIVTGILFLLVQSLVGTGQHKTGDARLKLWYKQPAGNVWESALPIGNGRLGAMVYGNVEKETIQLNEHTVWSGGPNRNDNPLALDSLDEMRQLIFSGKYKEAERMANRVIVSKKSHGQKFEPVGNLHLAFEGHDGFTDYYRELDIEQAVSKTTYSAGGVIYTRETFASLPDRVVVMRLSASRPGAISFTAAFSTPQKRALVKTTADHELTIGGITSDHETVKGMVAYKGIVRFKTDGGQITKNDTSVTIQQANAVTLYISIATNFNRYDDVSGNETARATEYLNKAFGKTFDALRAAHVKAYQQYFNRVKLNLGTTESINLPTDERLRQFSKVNDPHFAVVYYQFGRYLLISSSQPGGQPANLQGIWNHRLSPPWDSKYTININAQMNYWPAEKTNLAELHEPFLTMVKEMAETGKQTARDMYGARGWLAHHNTDIWRITGSVDGAFWGLWNAGGGWTSQHLWEHYLYSGDKAYLKSVYPVLKSAALFYVDFLVEHPKYKWLVVCPGTSPENAPKAHEGSSIDAGATMDNQIVFDVFSTAIAAAGVLNTDKAFTDTLRAMRNRLPPMHIGRHGQLQEWLEDIDGPNDKHRHISHLYGLFPSNQVSAYRTPELLAAARTTLLHRGDVSTGWSMGWKVNWWARLQDGNHAYKLIQNQLTPLGVNPDGGGTYPNLFDAHPPFQIDGNFGCTSGITEMLMQSANGDIHLLPALPDAWPNGEISGIRTIGGFTIKRMEWKNGRITRVEISSALGGNLRLRAPNTMKLANGTRLAAAKGENTNPFFQVPQTPKAIVSAEAKTESLPLKETLLFDLPTQAGKTYVLEDL